MTVSDLHLGSSRAPSSRVRARAAWLLATAALLPLVLTACTGQRAPSPAPDRTPAAHAVAVTAVCPNSEGGSCLGALKPRVRYATKVFDPAITYSVPTSGWSNFEDLPGNFLLVPPGSSLVGVNAGTSDFIGVYTSIAPAAFDHLPDCDTPPVANVARTPRAFASWIRRLSGVTSTTPAATRLGGLPGFRVDLRLKPHATVPHCIDDESGQPVSVLPVLVGVDQSSLEHGLIPHLTMRLYLLAYRGGVLGIELDDIDSAPGDLSSLAAVAERLRFGL